MLRQIFLFFKGLFWEETTERQDFLDETRPQPHPKYWEPWPAEQEPIFVVNPLTAHDLSRRKRKAKRQLTKKGRRKQE